MGHDGFDLVFMIWVCLKMKRPFLVKKVYFKGGKGRLILRHPHMILAKSVVGEATSSMGSCWFEACENLSS
jgi:hypothetical protein